MEPIRLGFYNLCVPLDKDHSELNYPSIFYLNQQNYRKHKQSLPDKVLLDLNVPNFLHSIFALFVEKKIDDSKFDQFEYLNNLANSIGSYIVGLINGLRLAIKDGIVKTTTAYYPFIRVSPETNSYFISFFTEIEYFDGQKELWITDHIPDSLMVRPAYINEHITSAFSNVRYSYFPNNSIYKYCDHIVPINTQAQFSFCKNYILEEFIRQNILPEFHINLNTSPVCLASNNHFEPNVIYKRKNKTLKYNQQIYMIGLKPKSKSYIQYAQVVMENLFRFSTLPICLSTIDALLKKEAILSEYLGTIKYGYLEYLDHLSRSEHLNYGLTVKTAVCSSTKYKRLCRIGDMFYLASRFLDGNQT